MHNKKFTQDALSQLYDTEKYWAYNSAEMRHPTMTEKACGHKRCDERYQHPTTWAELRPRTSE
ncbi:MAG: hypothetical protein K2Y01_04500 [Rhabdochlamydiaceae bacterium]|nr:hypothetical protein [Rhabdochlamydiaceae bacterium]